MSGEMEADFEKADVILSSALEQFQGQGVNQYVWGMALIEVGVLALTKLDEDDDSIIDSVRQFIEKSRNPMPAQPS
jgi:hypothetical protein